MPKVAITVSESLLADLDAIAERDAPGAPNRSATGLRLLAQGIAEEKRIRPLEHRGGAREAGEEPER